MVIDICIHKNDTSILTSPHFEDTTESSSLTWGNSHITLKQFPFPHIAYGKNGDTTYIKYRYAQTDSLKIELSPEGVTIYPDPSLTLGLFYAYINDVLYMSNTITNVRIGNVEDLINHIFYCVILNRKLLSRNY